MQKLLLFIQDQFLFLGRDFKDKIFELNKQSIEEIGEYGKELGVNAAIENMPTLRDICTQIPMN